MYPCENGQSGNLPGFTGGFSSLLRVSRPFTFLKKFKDTTDFGRELECLEIHIELRDEK